MSPTTITAGSPVCTLINVFTVVAERQQELVTLLEEATEQAMRHRDGFVTANIHASTDGIRVVNYAQWRDEAAFRAMLADPEAQVHMTQAAKIAESFEPHLYTVESVHSRGVSEGPAEDVDERAGR